MYFGKTKEESTKESELSWNDVKDKFSTKINEEVEYRIKKIRDKEEENKRIQTHKEIYPIGSSIEYLGVKMMIKENMLVVLGSEYYKQYTGLLCEWADKNDVLHTKQFQQQEFKYIKTIPELKVETINQ